MCFLRFDRHFYLSWRFFYSNSQKTYILTLVTDFSSFSNVKISQLREKILRRQILNMANMQTRV